jgi:GAF domain-containing protein
LISKDQVIGVLSLRATQPNAYTETDLRLTERVGNQIAGAIANAQLFIEHKRAEEEREKLIHQLQDALTDVEWLTTHLCFLQKDT